MNQIGVCAKTSLSHLGSSCSPVVSTLLYCWTCWICRPIGPLRSGASVSEILSGWFNAVEPDQSQVRWDRPKTQYQYMVSFRLLKFDGINIYILFIKHSEWSDFLINDNLHFYIKEVRID